MLRFPARRVAAVATMLACAAAFAGAATAATPITERASIGANGPQGDGDSTTAAVSADGRYVAFVSAASNLVADDTNGQTDVFVKDRRTGTIERISVDSTGAQADSFSNEPDISADGRYVAFTSYATNLGLAEGVRDEDGALDVFVHDRVTGRTEPVSWAPDFFGNGTVMVGGMQASLSGDSRFVAFRSGYRYEGAGQEADIYLRDRDSGTVERVSADRPGLPTGQTIWAGEPDVSADGRFVAYTRSFANFGSNPSVVEVRDRQDATTTVIGNGWDGSTPSGSSGSPSISDDGRRVAFQSTATTLIEGESFSTLSWRLFVWDGTTGAIARIGAFDGGDLTYNSGGLVLSGDGSVVAFHSNADNVLGTPVPPAGEVYRHDLTTGVTTVASVDANGDPSLVSASTPAIDGDGSVVAFETRGSLVADDDGLCSSPKFGSRNCTDVYVRDLDPTPAVTDPDADDDGIDDDVDTQPATPSAAFDDGDGTTGEITAANGLAVTISDVAAPSGVRVVVGAGAGHVSLMTCGGYPVDVDAGSEVVLTCGSVTVHAIAGSARVVVGGGITVVAVPTGAIARVNATGGGQYAVYNLGDVPVSVTVDGVTTTLAAGASTSLATWHFSGFAAPVDNGGVVNVARAGSTVPLKWRLVDAAARPVTTLAAATIRTSPTDCLTGTVSDVIEDGSATGGSGLQNLGDGSYQLNWKTASTLSGCVTLKLDLGEGIMRTALFRLRS